MPKYFISQCDKCEYKHNHQFIYEWVCKLFGMIIDFKRKTLNNCPHFKEIK